MTDITSNEEKLKRISKAIRDMKESDNPDKKKEVKRLIKQYQCIEKCMDNFGGTEKDDDKKVRCQKEGWRSPSLGLWPSDDERLNKKYN